MRDFSRRIADLPTEQRRLLEARLAEKRASRGPAEVITPRNSVGPSPLSFPQQRLWFLDQLEPGSAFYNLPVALRLTGPIDRPALEGSLNEIVERHEILRTTFRVTNDRPQQIVSPHERTTLNQVDLTGIPENERQQEATKTVLLEAARPFDLSSGPLLRALIVRLSETDHVLLLAMHHIISDGWSIDLLLSELADAYGALSRGRPHRLPALPIQFADFSTWQREWLQGERLESEVAYWKDALAGAPFVLELPTDRPRPKVKSFRGARHVQSIPEQLTDRLREVSRREGATLFMTLLAAFYVLLFRYTGQRDILVGTPIAGRDREELELLIGFFVNTLVLRGDLSGNPPFTELLARIREMALGAYAHQSMPFERIVEELKPDRDATRTPLFQLMFALQHAGTREFQLPGIQTTPFRLEGATARFDLFLSMTEGPRDVVGLWEFDTDLFDAARISRMADHLEVLLEAIAAHPERRISDLALLPESERRLVEVEWNNTAVTYPRDQSIQQLFEAQVERTPESTAFTYGGETLTYRELNLRANRLAHDLQHLGVGPESLVGISVPRSLEMIVAVFATLKAGAAYLPLDPSYPADRLAYMLADARPAAILTTRQAAALLPEGTTGKVIFMDGPHREGDRESARNPLSTASAENPAYVIYTSGSTGKPKGVVGLHRGAVNRFHWMWTNYPFRPGEICCQKTSLSFVDSVWEIFGPALAGVPTVVLPEEIVRDVSRLVDTLAEKRITRLVLVPALLRAILDQEGDLADRLGHLRLWVSSGEALREDLVERFYDRLPAATLLNLYGSSEASADSTVFDTRGNQAFPVPIGRPIANHRVFLLDDSGQPVPVGISGEIHISGGGVARGYWNRPALTAERFRPDPFAADAGGRFYKTGDLGRYRADGAIEYLGRTDLQTKIRGHRVEPGEIEASLAEHPAVREAAVVARPDAAGEDRLIAYVVPGGDGPPAPAELRAFLAGKLPDSMIPALFVALESLPRTPSGKLDRRALPAPDPSARAAGAAYEPPRTNLESALASVWGELLGTERVGIHDDFFELGGHSLLATQLVSRVRKLLRLDVPLRLVFESSTVAGLALAISQRQAEALDSRDIARLLDEIERDTPGARAAGAESAASPRRP